MNDSGSNTHRPRAIDPKRFRDVATGTGYSVAQSATSGARRNMEVAEHMPPAQRRAAPAAEGFAADPYEGIAESGPDSGFDPV